MSGLLLLMRGFLLGRLWTVRVARNPPFCTRGGEANLLSMRSGDSKREEWQTAVRLFRNKRVCCPCLLLVLLTRRSFLVRASSRSPSWQGLANIYLRISLGKLCDLFSFFGLNSLLHVVSTGKNHFLSSFFISSRPPSWRSIRDRVVMCKTSFLAFPGRKSSVSSTESLAYLRQPQRELGPTTKLRVSTSADSFS